MDFTNGDAAQEFIDKVRPIVPKRAEIVAIFRTKEGIVVLTVKEITPYVNKLFQENKHKVPIRIQVVTSYAAPLKSVDRVC